MIIGVSVHERVTPDEPSFARELGFGPVGGVTFGARDLSDRPVPSVDARELAHSTRVVDAVAYAATEEVGTCKTRFLEWEGIFSRGKEVAEAAPEAII